MNFLGTIVLLAGLVCFILFPYFAGHGLAIHEPQWIGIGAVFGVIAVILLFALKRMTRDRPADH